MSDKCPRTDFRLSIKTLKSLISELVSAVVKEVFCNVEYQDSATNLQQPKRKDNGFNIFIRYNKKYILSFIEYVGDNGNVEILVN